MENTVQLTCKTCGQGILKQKKKYRMSIPVVVIGYLFLIPSILGMLFGIMMLCATGSSTSSVQGKIKAESRTKLEAVSIPSDVIDDVLSLRPVANTRLSVLTPQQRDVVNNEEMSMTAKKLGAGTGSAIAGGLSIFMIVSSFVGGLLGWLLVMKKKVLQCTACGATVAAD